MSTTAADPTAHPPSGSLLAMPTGHSGIKAYGGVIAEEFHPDLQGTKAVKIYREMADNCSAISAPLLLMESLISGCSFEIRPKPGRRSVDHQRWAAFAESCRLDLFGPDGAMGSWPDFLSEFLTMRVYGFALFEEWYKVRRGKAPVGEFATERDRRRRFSRYDDGLIGWGGWGSRSQDSVSRWQFDESGNHVTGIWQINAITGAEAFLPIEKLMLFRPRAPKNSPEGKSDLRPLYPDYYHLKHIRAFEAIAIERELCGLPKMEVPGRLTSPNASPEERAELAAAFEHVQSIRRGEYEGIVMPAEMMEGTNLPSGWKFSLVTSGGSRQISTSDVLKRLQSAILIGANAQFLELGAGMSGSFALADVKTDNFARAAGRVLQVLKQTFDTITIPRLMELNGVSEDLWPELWHSDLETPDMSQIADYLTKLQATGALTLDAEDERWIRERAGMPARNQEAPAGSDPPRPSRIEETAASAEPARLRRWWSVTR